MNSRLKITKASKAEFQTAIEWAAGEGWNPGLDDLAAFHAVDPEGFLMGWVDGKPVSSISVVRYGTDFGFLGFYIVHPYHRGTGVGIETWNAGMAHLEGRSIGLDGVVEQQDNYRKSGFAFIGQNIRYSGIPQPIAETAGSTLVRRIMPEDMAAIHALDDNCFGMKRSGFIENWCRPLKSEHRISLVSIDGGQLSGFGTIRKCREGYKSGPLFCEDIDAALALFNGLIATVEPGSTLTLDVPEANSFAVQLAQSAGLKPVFKTARMVRGNAPHIDWNFVFGITSFELG